MAQNELDLIGVHELMPSEDYHKAPGISFTGFKEFLRSPKHYQHFRANPPEPTASQILGQLVHALVLEPDTVPMRFAYIEGPMNANPWKKQADEAKKLGLTTIGPTAKGKAMGMAEAILKHPEAAHLIKTGKKEISGFARHPLGFVWKARADLLQKELGIIADVKYVDDASEAGWERQCLRMKYQYQSAWYLDVWSDLLGVKLERHLHILVEEEGPHEVQLHALSDWDLGNSRSVLQKKLEVYVKCWERNEWPGYDAGVRTTILPHYAYKLTEEGEVME